MSYKSFADAPNQIKREGSEITIKFIRHEDGTATVSWTIPVGVDGCAADGTGAYDGILITVDGEPANYISTSPRDGTFYTDDPTVDRDLHVGDKIATAMVVGAFYNDRKTTSLTLTDIKARTPYFISGYAVDNVGRYHREGVHAYSLPTGQGETHKATKDKGAFHDILVDVVGGINLHRPTGLVAGTMYDFRINVNGDEFTINVDGIHAPSYKKLIEAINKEFKLLENPYISTTKPNASGYYWNAANKRLFIWDGTENIEQDVIISPLDPSVPVLGAIWFNPVTNILKRYEVTGWVVLPYVALDHDPTNMECGQLWYDGTDVWEWEGTKWCKLCLYVQTRNPLSSPLLGCDTYWHNDVTRVFYSYNDAMKKWDEVDVIVDLSDPNSIAAGDKWYNSTDEKVYTLSAGIWVKQTRIRYLERDTDGYIPNPKAGQWWYIPSERRLFQRDLMNLQWTEMPFTSYPTDPRVRKSCDLWWDGTNQLRSWDALNNQWVVVTTFFHNVIDPALPEMLPECAVWLNPETGEMKKLLGDNCEDVDYITLPFDPTDASLYGFWHDIKNDIWYQWNVTEWEEFDPIVGERDPFVINIGEYWWDSVNGTLNRWNGTSWDVLSFSLVPLAPVVGQLWYTPIEDELYIWNGTAWMVYPPRVTLQYIKGSKRTYDRDVLEFYTRDTGCDSYVEVYTVDNNLFSALSDNVMYLDFTPGSSGKDAGTTYEQLGVGDDGSPDERRQLHDSIRLALGMRSVTVELTKAQLDECIDNALLVLRKHSSFSYRRAMFFLDIKRNQQTYLMTNKCVGFNKIVSVNSLHRMGTAFHRTAFGGNDMFGIATLQRMYSIGSFDMLSYHLVASYVSELETLFATRIMFNWNETTRELKSYQNFFRNERVLVDANIERTEQDLFTDRETRMWIKEWSIASAKMMLSQVRGKFQNLPGPNGSTAFNTSDLIMQATEEMERLRESLSDMVNQNLGEVGMRAHFILG